ncbi:hypothetical protein BT96DRAFT_972771 [Gymnopus androsaceus JB14]|uniref:Uncharacterized protein n=1 Tax=Gymnopus androsaceus JB14 TaxID=1447944 RepID=A0A6A4HZS9_9AGAR|nr:hypothetical protein BT96DRAFT_972771 [Gymnopus androsaceus JB14]
MAIQSRVAIYYYKGFYFLYYYSHDGYPQGLGVKFIKEIPSDPVEFEDSIAAKKKKLEGFLRDLQRRNRDEYDDDDGEKDPLCGQKMDTIWDEGKGISLEISREWPRDVDTTTIYEINLEHYVFYFGGEPYFDLRNMPNADFFCAYLDIDSRDYELPSGLGKS